MRSDITRELDVEYRGDRRMVTFPAQVFRRPDQAVLMVRRIRLERHDEGRAVRAKPASRALSVDWCV